MAHPWGCVGRLGVFGGCFPPEETLVALLALLRHGVRALRAGGGGLSPIFGRASLFRAPKLGTKKDKGWGHGVEGAEGGVWGGSTYPNIRTSK